jgi:hypothetical protein
MQYDTRARLLAVEVLPPTRKPSATNHLRRISTHAFPVRGLIGSRSTADLSLAVSVGWGESRGAAASAAVLGPRAALRSAAGCPRMKCGSVVTG